MAKKRKSHKAKTTAKTTTHKRGRKKGSKSKLKSLTTKSMSPKAKISNAITILKSTESQVREWEEKLENGGKT